MHLGWSSFPAAFTQDVCPIHNQPLTVPPLRGSKVSLMRLLEVGLALGAALPPKPVSTKTGAIMRYLLADKGYETERPSRSVRDAAAVAVIPGPRNRKRAIRYDKLSVNFLSGVALSIAVVFWL